MAVSRKPVAFLTRELVGGTTPEQLFDALVSSTRAQKQDLVIFRGGQLGKDHGAAIYDLVNASYQGVITWASSDADAFTSSYYKRYAPVPVVTLTLQIPPYPVVTADSYAGMRAIVEHLITVHGKKRLAFIRGPEVHPSAKERFQAYTDVLKEKHISLDDKLVSPYCNWGKDQGVAMVTLFVDERRLVPGKDFDALVCVNDNIAIGAIEEFQKRGIRVPEDIAVTGCNDTVEARALTPPVTTVALPSGEQGSKALELVTQAAAGRTPAPATSLPGQLVLGQSCGCRSHMVEAASAGWHQGLSQRVGNIFSTMGLLNHRQIAIAMKDSVATTLRNPAAHETLLLEVADKLLAAFLADLRSFTRQEQFMAALADATTAFARAKLATDLLHNYISVLRARVLPSIRRRGRLVKAEDIWAQGRVMLSEATGRLRAAATLKAVAQERALGQLGAKLVTTHDIPAILKILHQDLPKLGIPSFYLAVYENAEGWDHKSVARHLKVLTAYGPKGPLKYEGSQARFESAAFIPSIITSSSECQSLLVQPLHSNDIQIGLAVFGIGNSDGGVYDTIKVQLSSALYGALLRQTLRETLSVMEQKVAEVSASSEEINLSVQNGSSSMEGVAHGIHDISSNIQEVMTVVHQAVELTVSANREIDLLNAKALEISKILGLIGEIAKRTNLLALNASIEAARAGEAGRGFAVVADEVKSLALTTASSSANIGSMIGNVQDSTRLASTSMSSVNDIMQQIATLSGQISAAIATQEASTSEVSGTLHKAAQGTSQIAGVLATIDAIGKSAQQL